MGKDRLIPEIGDIWHNEITKVYYLIIGIRPLHNGNTLYQWLELECDGSTDCGYIGHFETFCDKVA